VEGIGGGGFKTHEGASTMVLLPLIRSPVDVVPVADIMAELVEGFGAALRATAGRYLPS
jgi:hypothetical protein